LDTLSKGDQFIMSIAIGTGYFSASPHITHLPREERLKRYRTFFEIRSRHLFGALTNYFRGEVGLREKTDQIEDLTIKLAANVRSLLLLQEGDKENFNDSLVLRLACVIEPEALAQIFACLLEAERGIQPERLRLDLISRALRQAVKLVDFESGQRPSYLRARVFAPRLLSGGDRSAMTEQGFSLRRVPFDSEMYLIKMRPADREAAKQFIASQGLSIERGPAGEWSDGLAAVLTLIGYR